jgi:hypothetical protein
MQTSTLILLIALAFGAPAVLAQEEDHSAHHPPAAGDAPDNAAEEGASPSSGGHDHGAARPSPARENMSKVERLMQQIRQTSDPAEKRALLRDHLQALREQMKLVRSESGGMKMAMKGEGKKGGGMMGEGGGMMRGGMMGMHKKVEQRLEMLERVLQQLIEHEGIEAELENR